ncbi:GNAT family N-acetyltransferase [Irregularibacter muris]|uniref:GNAT family N-acetyltransferase n=1 Tax=Irregularibacter muris TaxID=1796619 RepID=A0AAE3HIA9_9FIRM|nr:GNAT family protein [Irregularibacter muris]MCR1899915.1 GNAT family N-acetyltransferase [Irregularibacter muris]
MTQVSLKDGSIITIRKAVSSDAKEVLEYIHKISSESDFLTFGEGEFHRTIEQQKNFIYDIAKRKNALFIVAEIDGKIVGNLNFSGGLRPRMAHTGEFGLSVLQEYWGKGIGTKLIKNLIQWCKKSETIRKINLKVRNDNHLAIHLYKKLGFKQEGIITRDFLVDNRFYDSIFMGLTID